MYVLKSHIINAVRGKKYCEECNKPIESGSSANKIYCQGKKRFYVYTCSESCLTKFKNNVNREVLNLPEDD
jgi:hypothetical protein